MQAFDVARRELGVTPLMTGKEMASCKEPDELTVRAYLSQFYELFKDKPLTSGKLSKVLLLIYCRANKQSIFYNIYIHK